MLFCIKVMYILWVQYMKKEMLIISISIWYHFSYNFIIFVNLFLFNSFVFLLLDDLALGR